MTDNFFKKHPILGGLVVSFVGAALGIGSIYAVSSYFVPKSQIVQTITTKVAEGISYTRPRDSKGARLELVPVAESIDTMFLKDITSKEWDGWFKLSFDTGTIFEGRYSDRLTIRSPDNMKSVQYVDMEQDGIVNRILLGTALKGEQVINLDTFENVDLQRRATIEKKRLLEILMEE